jgi:hypothetical protein
MTTKQIVLFTLCILVYLFLFYLLYKKTRKNQQEKDETTWSVREGMLIFVSALKLGMILQLGSGINELFPDSFLYGLQAGYWFMMVLFSADMVLTIKWGLYRLR